ncbi:hypothetical protein INT43_005770 [Umbelopsis isabellina]|uniref:Major facilitator superfamily (MFS) profile domain-containing protein n=1 Tax=Mortierella isabellina TaxID=91625 RepID=A0A8H7UAT1_MORIS|nr:hypothetical protein INT43_005770 [Umbelopsis isabellina]
MLKPSISRLEQCKTIQERVQAEQSNDTDLEAASTTAQDEKPAISAPLSEVESDEKPYSAFSQIQKSIILAIVGLAGAASTLSSSIYLPALTAIQEVSFCSNYTIDFATTPELINITISLYMTADLLDNHDYLCRLKYWFGSCTQLFRLDRLANAPNYSALIVLRMLQAFGATSVIAVGAGCIGDIASPSQRGVYFSIYSAGPLLGPILGPIMGGVVVLFSSSFLAQNLGWRWIFWLLLILAGLIFIMVLFFLPESLRSLVGDGSGYANPTPQQWWKRRVLKKRTTENLKSHSKERSRFLQLPNVFRTFLYLLQPDVALYRDFKVVARQHGFNPAKLSRGSLPLDFPIFHARFHSVWIPLILFDVLIMIYGFLLWKEVHMAGPLVVHFFIGFCNTSLFSGIQALLIDLYPENSASISASNNFVRCLLGAASTATIQAGISAIGVHYMFLTLGLICFACNSILIALVRFGPEWRAQRMKREQEARRLYDDQEKLPLQLE